jgi:hypothetical protein
MSQKVRQPVKTRNIVVDDARKGETHSIMSLIPFFDIPVTSPIAEQASEFISKLVRNLQLQQTFGVPEKIIKHTKSQPIVAMEKDTVSSEEDEVEGNSIVNDGSARNAHPFKAPPTPPKNNMMDELKEKLAARAQKIQDSTTNGTTDEKATPGETRRKKPRSQRLKETPKYAETDTASMRGQLQPTDGACGTFMACFGDNAHEKQPPRVGDFLTVEEASLVLGKSGKWGGVSPMASAEAKEKSACQSVPEGRGIGNVSLSVSSDSGETWEESVNSRADDHASLAYSLATDNTREQKISQSCSGDSSMVPLRHGERERTKPSLSMLPASDELVIALSLSGESNNLTPTPQSVTNAGGGRPTKNRDLTPVHFVPERDQKHQEELVAKIHEFQQRKFRREENGDDVDAVSSDESLPPRNIKRLPVRSSTELPKASKKVAQAYVDALSKKVEDNPWPAVVVKKVSTGYPRTASKGKAQFDSMKTASTDLSDDVIPAPDQESTPTIKHTQSPPTNVKDMGSEVGRFSVDNRTPQEAGSNVGDLVSRIDDVVQRLVQSGKIDVDAGPSRGSELEKRTLRENTAELLQNLAILRARRESGSSSRLGSSIKSSHFSASSPTNDIPRSIPVKVSTLSTSQAESLPQEKNSNLQRLRAKRDQAAMAVQNRAQRLKSMSMDHSTEYGREENPIVLDNLGSENDNTLQKNPIGMYLGHSLSSAKAKGPPKPESFSKRVPSVPSFGAGVAEDRVEAGDRHGSNDILKTLSKTPTYDMASWEQEQLKELPLLLQTTFSGKHFQEKVEDYSYYQEKHSSKGTSSNFAGSEVPTSDYDSSSDEDDTTDYGSDDDSEQIDRIEIMIQELRARRMRL